MSRFSQSPGMPWSIDQSLNIDRISMEELKLIFNQAEKRLDSTTKEGENIASRTMSLYSTRHWNGFAEENKLPA